MNNNSLITQLNTTMSDENLPEVLGLKLYIKPTASGISEVYNNNVAWCPLRFSGPQTLKLTGNAYFCTNQGVSRGTEISNGANDTFFIWYNDTNVVELHISDRFHLDFGSSGNQLYFYPEDIADIAWCSQLTMLLLTLCNCGGDISILNRLTNLTAVDFYGTQISGKIESLKDYNGSLAVFNFRSQHINGNASFLPSSVIRFVGPGITWDEAYGLTWAANNRIGLAHKAVVLKNTCMQTTDDVDNYLTATATNNNTNPSDKAIVIGCRVAYTPSAFGEASIAVIKGWGWTISVNGTAL